MALNFSATAKSITGSSNVNNEVCFHFKNSTAHCNIMMKGIHQNWKNNEYCDIELTVGTGNNHIKAHKLILVSSCEYFSGLLKPSMLEGNQMSIKCLEHLNSEAVITLIEYCYTGIVTWKMTSEIEIEQLIEAADYMRLQEVCQKIASFLESHLNNENCLGFLQCADHYNLNKLKQSAFTYASHNYVGITEAEEFVGLPVALFKDLLKDEKLVIQKQGFVLPAAKQEEFVVNSVLKYIDHNKEERIGILEELLLVLKLPLMSNDQLTSLTNNECIKGNENCLKIIEKARHTASTKVNDNKEKWARPRKCHGLLLREFYEHASFGQVRPEIDRFDCRDVLELDNDVFVTGMKIGIVRRQDAHVIGGFQVFYSNQKCPVYGIDPDRCELQGEFQLNIDMNERIVKLDIQAGNLICKLVFSSSLGKIYGPYGGEGGHPYREVPPKDSCAYLAGVSGTVVKNHLQGSLNIICITKLKFMWGFYDFSEDQNMAKVKWFDSSRLCIYSANYEHDSTTKITLRKGQILALPDSPYVSQFPDDGRIKLVNVLHCKTGKLLTVSSLMLKKCEDDLWDPR